MPAEHGTPDSHETFRRLVEDAPFGIYVIDADFRLAVVSAGAQKVFKNVTPLLGRDFAEVLRIIWPEPAASEFIARFRRTLETGEPYRSPRTVERRADSGETEAYDWKIERIGTPDGRLGLVCYFYDWTERQTLEAAVRESREQLATELAGMTRLHELSLRLTGQNDLDQVMHEVMLAAGELLGSPLCTAQLLDASRPEAPCLRLAAISGFDESFAERFRIVTADGFTTCAAALRQRTRVIVQDARLDADFGELAAFVVPLGIQAAMSTPLLSSDGSLLGVFTTYWAQPHRPSEHQLRLVDLYAQQAARQVEKRSAERALGESEQRLEAEVADLESLRRLSMRVAATSDRTTALNDVLDTAIPMVGASKGNVQLYDASDDTLKIISHRGFNRDFLEFFGSVPLGYSCCGAAMERRERVIIEDATIDPTFRDLAAIYARHGFVAVQSTPLFTSDGRLLGMFSTHFARPHRPSERDLRLLDQIGQQAGRIIERTQAEQTLRRHAETLQELVEERTREIMEAHERLRLSERMASLGTLSAGLGHDMGNLLMPVRVRLEALAAMQIPEEASRELADIKSSLEYLQRLAGGLRQLAIDPARTTTAGPTELRGWWTEACTVLKNTLPRGVRLDCLLPEDNAWVAFPRAALTQSVFNLVQNAGDSMRARTSGKVTIAIGVESSHVLVSVRDDGPGMSEEVKRRCMEPFYTTKTRGVSTGLGLALVYSLVQEARGTISLESAPGVGTTFTLKLPRAAPPSGSIAPRRIAVVDVSDPRLRAIVTGELAALSYAVRSGPGGHPDADLIVADRLEAGPVDSQTRLVLLAEPGNAPPSALALGTKPRIQTIRQALRAVSSGQPALPAS